MKDPVEIGIEIHEQFDRTNRQLQEYQKALAEPEKRLCDCLQCRMGKQDRCTTFSPRNSKRRGKR